MIRSTCFTTLATFLLGTHAPATPLRIDFDSTNITQSGWESISPTDSWSKSLSGGINLEIAPIGNVTLDHRDRGANNGGGGEASMWRDFLFANGSFSSVPGSGLNLSLSGLIPNTEYPITVWAFDSGSGGGRAADWSGSGSSSERLLFQSNPTPASLDDNHVTFTITTNSSGAASITGLVATANPSGSHNVFINGLEIGDPIANDGPTNIALSSNTVAKTATTGTPVGSLTTIAPTPTDSFSYLLTSGDGDTHNGLFIIENDSLQTDRDLSEFPGGTMLSVRIRTTDISEAFFEKSFLIEVLNDSDDDQLDDDWELRYFPDLTTATGTGNNDSDTLTNIEEQTADTDPTKADTDGDTLNDDAELLTYSTNPLLGDTDDDGIPDNEELAGTLGYITDPNKKDTDDDGFPDALEIAEQTDPTNGADFPNTLIPMRINELLTRNTTDINDGDGSREDWIELYNPNNIEVNLDGYYLTDNSANLTKWNFPEVTIPANGYLLVFASGDDHIDNGGFAHTNFSLDSGGEYLALVRPDGSTIDDSFSPTYPEQFTNISYGPPTNDGPPVFFQTSTPGAINNTPAFPGVVKDTNFSSDRGFYSAPIELTISTDTSGATIHYTLDGSEPSPSHGTPYAGPIEITSTSTIRAIAFFGNWISTNVDTHTYLFVDDIAQQPANPAGWPDDWGFNGEVADTVPSDYEMDPRVVNNTNGLGEHTIQEALLDIPSVSITLPQDDVTGGSNGLYTNPQGRFEHECSVEYILPDGTRGFQEDCKIETHGNSSRRPARMQKHSLRLTFSSSVGVPKLDYPLFPDSEIEEFNKLVLRACFTDSWALNSWSTPRYRPNDAQYFRDVWMKDSLGSMGQPTSYGNFVHVYLNGLYFGLHNLTERLEDDWYADHIGGEKEDWLINKDLSAPPAYWNAMMSIANGNITDNTVYESIKDYLDVENYADYMLLHFYADSEDWPHHNGYAAANFDSGDGKFRFFVWDQEIALDKFSWNQYSNGSGGGAPFQRLRLNDEFRILFADRVHQHMFNSGALSESNSIDRYLGLANQIDKAIVAESARWGDTQANTPYGDTAGSSNDPDGDYHPPTLNDPIYFTREQHWLVERVNVTQHYIPTLHDTSDSRSIIRELRANNLYPSIDAPIFSQHGGIVPNEHQLLVTATTGAIYYTLDGSDPRDVGGGIHAGSGMLAGGATSDTLIDFEATGWRYLDTGIAQSDSEIVAGHPSYNTLDWKHPDFEDATWGTGQAMLGYGTIGSATIRTTVGPANAPRNPTTYFRKEFIATDTADYTTMSFELIRDDGAIVYLNGREVGRSNLSPGNKTYSSLATPANPEDEIIQLSNLTLSPGDLVNGINVIAVEVHQQSTTSSDLGMDLRVKATKPNSGDSTITLTQTGTLKARALNSGEWSALTSAEFIVGTTASASNLVVSEIYYNPPTDEESTEWIELMNISVGTIDLTDVTLTGITYTFPTGWLLPAGERIVIVKNQLAFAVAFDTTGITIAPGEFTSNLSNSGEELAIIDATGDTDIQRFTYLDTPPWPTAPDGQGYSLVLIAPETSPDHGIATNWRSSVKLGGSPGTSDATTFSGNPNLDEDGDGLPALLEYAFGSLDGDAGVSPESQITAETAIIGEDPNPYLVIRYRRNLAADDLHFEVQVGNSLNDWTNLGTAFVSSQPNGDGTETITYRSITPFASIAKEFIRVEVTQH